jgi:hypothetical protein
MLQAYRYLSDRSRERVVTPPCSSSISSINSNLNSSIRVPAAQARDATRLELLVSYVFMVFLMLYLFVILDSQ